MTASEVRPAAMTAPMMRPLVRASNERLISSMPKTMPCTSLPKKPMALCVMPYLFLIVWLVFLVKI